MNKTITTAEAVEQLVNHLSSDEDYYFSWQANIAVSFIDELREKGYDLPDQHEIANTAAENFLDLLIFSIKEFNPELEIHSASINNKEEHTITTAEAVERIAKELNNDKDYYFSWQSNIAVPFIDALNEKGYELPDQHEIANKAAKVFLNRLINIKINLDNQQKIVLN
jgi:DNA-directed RNA polymerase specialized sigma54-like protein